ncbi:DUF1365 domain-containing protein [Spongiibacter sp. KMU-158]|uniref:DUF1365 domain-containing protein n=1 Tax=Spongiibacter pelagi TaxID=2760804 RepID=A0A927C0V7_9GAMM|nr:DUF1365 domain-containing protein [Spongiibacter pelagi]MBD2859199.1 DUF1365 domain-containing protein [Spongiibacter pelagi]
MSSDAVYQSPLKSGVYRGRIRHRRYSPKPHAFSYPLYMLALDLDELEQLQAQGQKRIGRWLGINCWAPIAVHREDYLRGCQGSLKKALQAKVAELGGDRAQVERVVLVCQPRCFGLYFSPINLFFCYDANDQAVYMVAEVSNTPWNERHYYLVHLATQHTALTDKAFHVSPFMPMDMQYHWQVTPPAERLRINIENRNTERVFDATLAMRRSELTAKALRGVLLSHPNMVLSMLKGIYWQALRLFLKRTPLHLYPKES